MTSTRSVGVVTTSRADYGIYRPVLRRMAPSLFPWMFVAGSHLSERFGSTVREIEADGHDIAARIALLPRDDSSFAVAESIGLGVTEFARAFDSRRPDLLLVLGDRYEMFAAVAAAVPLRLPVAHLHGGERSEGAIDESFRHAITKMSHLHFVATEAYRSRVIRLGEEPWRVTLSGAPSLDNLHDLELAAVGELESFVGLTFSSPPLLITVHPETLAETSERKRFSALAEALDRRPEPLVFTMPNADAGGAELRNAIQAFVATHPNSRAIETFGTRRYFGIMRIAAAMIGNSSSGIIEAASFRLPVLDVGDRQRGRLVGINVAHAAWSAADIAHQLERILAPSFRAGLDGLQNPYGDGQASSRIVEKLARIPLDSRLIQKRFYDGE